MKNIFLKTIICGAMVAGMTSCADDLNISSIDPQSSTSYDDMSLLAKAYGTLGLTGQTGAAGNGDLSCDEGESGFYRTTFNLETLPTDECNWAWQTDTDIPQITGIAWNANSQRVEWTYQRLGFDITLFNTYLQETAGRTDGDYKHYRAEVRFLRALHYWYFLDLWHMAPFKDDTNAKSDLPTPKVGKDLYDWIDKELTEIAPLLAESGSFCNEENFGRADRGAAWLLHARLALNSEVYTDGQTKDFQKAYDYADSLIKYGNYNLSKKSKYYTETMVLPKHNSSNQVMYDLNGNMLTETVKMTHEYSGYAQLFMADNDENKEAMQEIILPIRQDGQKTKSYSAANYLVSSIRNGGMPYAGTTNCWGCNYARPNLIEKFFPNDNIPMATTEADPSTEANVIALDSITGTDTKSILKAAGDDRALFYAGCGGGIRKLSTDKLNNFLDGISVVKFQNIRTDGKSTNDQEFPDMDVPLLRFAEAYLVRAEALYRLGGDQRQILDDINTLRERAHTNKLLTFTEDDIIDEWCREFYMEGRRRSDLIRFGRFTGKKYVWAWKGGVASGQSVDSHFNFYPIPLDDINNNPNLKGYQNAGY